MNVGVKKCNIYIRISLYITQEKFLINLHLVLPICELFLYCAFSFLILILECSECASRLSLLLFRFHFLSLLGGL